MTGSHRSSRREVFPLVLHLEPEVPLARWEPGWCWWCQVPPAILLLPAPCCLGNSGICSYLLAKSSSASITSFMHQQGRLLLNEQATWVSSSAFATLSLGISESGVEI